MLGIQTNPLLADANARCVELADLTSPVVMVRKKPTRKRELVDLRRGQSAKEAIAGLTRENLIFGFTKGQFSMLDLLTACTEITGPTHMTLSTWTAARKEIDALGKLRESGALLGTRWLVDFTFARRDPSAANQIRTTFGVEAIRVAQNHAKFALFRKCGMVAGRVDQHEPQHESEVRRLHDCPRP